MKGLILNFLGVLTLLAVYTCMNDPETVGDQTITKTLIKTLVGTEWDLQSFEIVDVAESAVGSQGIVLILTKEGIVEGESRTIEGDLSVPGNSYNGVYEVDLDGSFTIEITGTTYVGLPPGSRYEEYIQALRSASAYEIDGNTLHIFYNGKVKALTFRAE